MGTNVIAFKTRKSIADLTVNDDALAMAIADKWATAAVEAHKSASNIAGNEADQICYLIASLIAKCRINEINFDALVASAKDEVLDFEHVF